MDQAQVWGIAHQAGNNASSTGITISSLQGPARGHSRGSLAGLRDAKGAF
jgi:hypothetical protein